jgi:hypothetical protein
VSVPSLWVMLTFERLGCSPVSRGCVLFLVCSADVCVKSYASLGRGRRQRDRRCIGLRMTERCYAARLRSGGSS